MFQGRNAAINERRAEELQSAGESVQKAFGLCRFPYEYHDAFKKMDQASQDSVIHDLIETESRAILAALDCAVGSYASRESAEAFIRAMPEENTGAAINNLALRAEPELRALSARYLGEDAEKRLLLRLAGDESECVREALYLNPEIPAEIAAKIAAPLGYVRLDQGENWDRAVSCAIETGQYYKFKPGDRAPWGSGIFRVNADHSTTEITSNWDSSG